MIIACCPKCKYPYWFGSFDKIPAGDLGCPICETVSNAGSADKFSTIEWRDKIIENDPEFAMVRNMLEMNFRAVAEKMDMALFLAEWKLVTLDDIKDEDNTELELLFREEFRCLLTRILKRLNERLLSRDQPAS